MKRLFGATIIASSIIGGAIGTAGGVIPGERSEGTDLGQLLEAAATAPAPGAAGSRQRLVVTAQPGQEAALAAALDAAGGVVVRRVGALSDVWVDRAHVPDLLSSPALATASPPQEAVEHGTGDLALAAAGGEGLSVIGAGEWLAAGYRGAGTTVALIDTGFGNWDVAAAAGEVPPSSATPTIDLCDAGLDSKNHGTGTAEVLHDVAPEADIVRVCIDDALDLSQVIDQLPPLGVSVVNMSLGFYNTGPGDGTGGPGSPDDSVRRALDAGLLWVNSAGNEARSHYAGSFSDPDGDGFHAWAGGDQLGSFTAPPGVTFELYLRWDEWPRRPDGDDFELCLTIDEAVPVTCLGNVPPAKGTPTTGVALTNPRTTPVTFSVAVKRRAGTGNPRLDFFVKGGVVWEHPVGASSLLDPAAVPGVLVVGATCPDTNAIQPTSSQGPTPDGRPGVSLVAPGAVSGLLFGPLEECRSGYGGTSAAAPHVAGALALMRQYLRHAPPADIVAELLARAERGRDLGVPGVDPVYGHGELQLGPVPPFAPGGEPEPGEPSPYGFAMSATADRAAPQPFAGATIGGDVYVFLVPTFPVPRPREVRFYVDGELLQVERLGGYDLGGGMAGFAYPFDTFRLSDGHHRLDAVVIEADGREQHASAAFVVDNAGRTRTPPTGVVEVAGSATPGQELAGDAPLALTLGPGAGPVHHVLFYVDAVLIGYDQSVPYTSAPATVAEFGPGQHMVQAIVFFEDGSIGTANNTFSFVPPAASAAPANGTAASG